MRASVIFACLAAATMAAPTPAQIIMSPDKRAAARIAPIRAQVSPFLTVHTPMDAVRYPTEGPRRTVSKCGVKLPFGTGIWCFKEKPGQHSPIRSPNGGQDATREYGTSDTWPVGLWLSLLTAWLFVCLLTQLVIICVLSIYQYCRYGPAAGQRDMAPVEGMVVFVDDGRTHELTTFPKYDDLAIPAISS